MRRRTSRNKKGKYACLKSATHLSKHKSQSYCIQCEREVQSSGSIITKKGPGEVDSDVGRRNLGVNNMNELMIQLIVTM